MVYILPSPCTSGMKVENSPDWKSIITAVKLNGILPSCSLKILPPLPEFTWHQKTQQQKQCNDQEIEYQKNRMGREQTHKQIHRRKCQLLYQLGPEGQVGENPAYGRHRLSRRLRIVAQII